MMGRDAGLVAIVVAMFFGIIYAFEVAASAVVTTFPIIGTIFRYSVAAVVLVLLLLVVATGIQHAYLHYFERCKK
jgi:hypothetical protein